MQRNRKMRLTVNRKTDNKNKINDRFLEMMSDYKNYNKLMNAAFSINTSVFT